MSVITQSTQVLHPDDRLALWYSRRHAYLNAAEIADHYTPYTQSEPEDTRDRRVRVPRKALPKLHTILQLFGRVAIVVLVPLVG
jgi:hypothetical protein